MIIWQKLGEKDTQKKKQKYESLDAKRNIKKYIQKRYLNIIKIQVREKNYHKVQMKK